jgi:NAD(P)H-dependent FMN reductase
VAQILKEMYDAHKLKAELYSLAELPIEVFDPGVYASKPAVFQAVQQRVVESAGLHVVTPEYNGSFPGILKYFIDLLKFPESFNHKPAAFTGLSLGMFGALRPVEQLQMVFSYRNAHLYPDRVFIPGFSKQLGPEGRLVDPELVKRLSAQAGGFGKFCGLIGANR